MPASIDLKKRVALVTGCSEPNSLGAAFSRELLSRNWTVFATARKLQTLDELKAAGCEVLELDVTSDESVIQAAKQVTVLTDGRLDLLINNAGATGSAPLLHTDPARLAAMHDLHVLGPLRLTQAFYPLLRSTASASGGKQRSKIVNIGSVISNGMPWHAAYASTKILSDVMRREFAPMGIDVITVELVKTAMSTGTKDFPLLSEHVDENDYDASQAIKQAGIEFEQSGKTAPAPSEIAKTIIDAAESVQSPGKLYLGKQSYIFRYVLPYLPIWAADALLCKIMRVDLVKGN